MTLSEAIKTRLHSIMTIRELKRRVTFTLLMFLVARIGVQIAVPGINMALFREFTNNPLAQFLDLFSGGAIQRASIFSLGITPMINASIVFQLLGVLYPKFEEMQREGGKQREKITQWTRYLAIAISVVQSVGIAFLLQSQNIVIEPGLSFVISTAALMTGGAAFLMWIAERISIKGIGNGTSMLIFLNIVSNLPNVGFNMVNALKNSLRGDLMLSLSLLLFIFIIVVMVIIQLGERRVSIQYVGKSSRGFGQGVSTVGKKTFLPVKINTAGVMPIIFASMLMAVPGLIITLIKDPAKRAYWNSLLGQTGWLYLLISAFLIIVFSFFYTAIVFDPDKIADSLKQTGGTIPNTRAGKETADYLEYIVTTITYGTAVFLAILGILPNIWFGYVIGMPVLIGGTSLIILVGVAVELLQQIDSHLAVRTYRGFNNSQRRQRKIEM
ncbi:preprotein translocase subunit SecY [Oceanivirga miroungae]|uniref:Protein translocase subunit SecY n=1 Tax=Oceanivirga miroungae TaxID=1130046 RepID=A0A6I8MBS8_9FUSO|nr:preprotein translocase subunit SecY [Oceanivirga miroungae]VWL84877.1 preprotein translocase subunit SecY [Oceanivirga miroungae]